MGKKISRFCAIFEFFNAKRPKFCRFSDMYHVTYQIKGNFMANLPVKEYCTKNVIFGHFVQIFIVFLIKKRKFGRFSYIWHVTYQIKDNFMAN